MDLFYQSKKWWLIIVDYYSRYPEIALLNKLTAAEVINHCNPHYPQSNGLAEAAVKIIKTSMSKTQDPYITLLAYRTTSLKNGYSPSQLLMGRRLRTKLSETVLRMLSAKFNDIWYEELGRKVFPTTVNRAVEDCAHLTEILLGWSLFERFIRKSTRQAVAAHIQGITEKLSPQFIDTLKRYPWFGKLNVEDRNFTVMCYLVCTGDAREIPEAEETCNTVARESTHFGYVFGCPSGSPMNPASRPQCSLLY
ncbi:uncharacterized protein LOC144161581 [Haemaphysalis longicornis]